MSEFIKESLKYVDINPRIWTLQGDPYGDMANLHHIKKDYKSAIEFYSKALYYGDRSFLLKYRGQCYARIRQFPLAIKDWEKYLQYNPEDKEFAGYLDNIKVYCKTHNCD